MAEVTKTGLPTISTGAASTNSRIGGWKAGETIEGGDALYIKGADGMLYRTSGAAADEKRVFAGLAGESGTRGKGVTILKGVNVGYKTDLPPGTLLYLSATVPGGFDTAPTTGGTKPVAQVMDGGIIHVYDAPGI